MSKNKVELDIVLTSTYTEIVLNILKIHKNLSVNKTLVFAYLIKKRKFINADVYTAANKNDLVLKCISQLSGLYNDYCENLKYIVSAIHLLIVNKKLSVNLDELIYIETSEIIIEEKSFINSAIHESKKYSDRQFLKEVVRSV
ncbi:hypothetical protein Ga0466249_004073 [Sporomusaceae bacterium BoRhaA]|uniref:hypothetical protein n=1 Tax=Pelorhabdus rhamnosifermentans TaxID=2772457 RepID=UPI001C060751|nr:hypothetical protein [Pelorhabdus rhamnosifermentans]MBU2702938.1 hypothetical protein [Pelorhabdus rhamnosifermentans]